MQAVVARLLAASSQAVNLDQISPASASFQPLEPLTDREKQILVYLANGVSNKEIARRIFVSENTVKFHLKNIYSKLAVSSRLQAINAARQMSLLNSGGYRCERASIKRHCGSPRHERVWGVMGGAARTSL